MDNKPYDITINIYFDTTSVFDGMHIPNINKIHSIICTLVNLLHYE